MFQNVGDDGVEAALKTAEAEPLHLVVLTVSNNITGVFLIGDTVTIRVPTDILSAALLLLICYYVFDIDYPRMYANYFSVLQTLAVGEPYLKENSKKCKFFTKKLRQKMQDLPLSFDESIGDN